jgi:5-methylthioadenosine/S-adenosylhomocysteine deaminase
VSEAVSAAWVVPVDGPPIPEGRVVWEDGVIVEVGPGRAERHHPDALLLPGIVNAHSHLEYAVYGGFADGEPFAEWLSTHMRRKRLLNDTDVLAIARCGALDALAAGVTTTADFSFSGASAVAAREFGLRAIVYLEVFGADSGVAAERYERLHASLGHTDLVQIGVSPHAPYTCSVEVYAWCLSLGVPVGTHLAESAAENAWLEHGSGPLAARPEFLVAPTGKRAVASLADVLGPRLLCAHGVELDTAEIELLGRLDVPFAHCPRSNAILGCGVAPLTQLRAAGLRVGLGTDSPASTPSLDPWEEMRAALYAARGVERRPDALSAAEALRLATLDSARALGMEGLIGSLTVGKRADITVLSTGGTPYDPVEDPVVAAVFAGSIAGVRETIVDGTTRYRQGETLWPEVRNIASAARARMLA